VASPNYHRRMSKDATDPLDNVASRILVVGGQRVILDSDLARLYGGFDQSF